MIEILNAGELITEVDVFVGCVGYEHRSIEALRQHATAQAATHKLLFSYESTSVCSFDKNIEELRPLDCKVYSDFQLLKLTLFELIAEGIVKTILLDVTSLDRKKIAGALSLIFDQRSHLKALSIIYFPREYQPPPLDLEEVLQFGPVTPRFVGEASYDREHLALVVGAGYEFGRVVGAIDVLEPEVTYCMVPTSADPRFEQSVMKNNLGFKFLDNRDLLLTYEVADPARLLFSLRRLVQVELKERNVLLLPLGPKIFAAVSLIVAILYSPSVMVWRHSTVGSRSPSSIVDATASGLLSQLSLKFT